MKAIPRKDQVLLYLEWMGSFSDAERWHNFDSIEDLDEVNPCVSVGWKIGESDKFLFIAATISEPCQEFMSEITIPKCVIIKQCIIKSPRPMRV